MNKILKTLFMTIIALSASVTLFGTKAEAVTNVKMPLQVVDDLDNVAYPSMTEIEFDNDRKNVSKITLESAGQIKALILSNYEVKQTGKIWISTDEDGNDIIGVITEYKEDGITEVSWFLENGTYYIHMTCDKYPFTVNVAFLFEKAKVAEDDISTSFRFSTLLEAEKMSSNYITLENPNEYYRFELKEKTNVIINYSFDSPANQNNITGYCSLYDKDELLLKEGTYSSTDKGEKSINYLLDPGLYYIKLSGMYGNTTIKISYMYYHITLTPDTDDNWTKKSYKVDIDTSIDYSKIAVLQYDVKESLLDNDELWSPNNKNYIELEGETFKAEKSGVYSVRITDKYGNNTMAKITISNIDVKKPKVYGVKDGKAYKKPVTVTWKDTQSGINAKKTTLNGKTVKSGVKISKEGKYNLKVYDNVGNCSSVTFYVDFTAPTAGVENGKTYNESLTLKFRDNVSGIKKITLDGAEVSAANNSMYIYTNGEYELKLWDNAGNYRKIIFHVKK